MVLEQKEKPVKIYSLVISEWGIDQMAEVAQCGCGLSLYDVDVNTNSIFLAHG